jgi:membrane protease YdiL (CAAX protease family)
MLTAGAIVAAVAFPVALLGWAVARRHNEPFFPAWKPWRVPWGGFEVFAAFLVLALVIPDIVLLGLSRSGFYQELYGPDFPSVPTQPAPPLEATAAVAGMPAAVAAQEALEIAGLVRRLWASSFALVVQLGLLFLAVRVQYPMWRRSSGSGFWASLTLGVGAWAILAPLVLAFNLVVNVISMQFDVIPEEHSLTKLGGRSVLDSVLFLFQTCLAAPIIEEVLFRGLVLSWALGSRKPSPGSDAPSKFRPWLVILVGILFAALSRRWEPVIFGLVLALGLAVIVSLVRSKRRTVSAIYSSAAFFGLVHSAVWPSPIPLFAFGLGLGWLAVRTRGVLVPIIVHGLFNAISTVYVLRGGAG